MFRHIASQSGLSLERLASLCEVAEAGSIGHASRADANKQSQLSRQIAELETVFGVALLARNSRPFRLTAEGRELAQAARSFFQAAEDVQKRASGGAQRVVIGAGEAVIQWLLFSACETLRQQDPGVTFVFKNLDSKRVVEGLQHGEIDMGLLRREDVPPSLQHEGDWRYSHAAFVPKTLSPAGTELKMADLASLPWAVLEGQGHFRQFLEGRAREHRVGLNIGIECSSYTQVAMAVQTGRYAGFLPAFVQDAVFATATPVRQKPLPKTLSYERTLTLASREATVRSRLVLERVIPLLRAQLDRAL